MRLRKGKQKNDDTFHRQIRERSRRKGVLGFTAQAALAAAGALTFLIGFGTVGYFVGRAHQRKIDDDTLEEEILQEQENLKDLVLKDLHPELIVQLAMAAGETPLLPAFQEIEKGMTEVLM